MKCTAAPTLGFLILLTGCAGLPDPRALFARDDAVAEASATSEPTNTAVTEIENNPGTEGGADPETTPDTAEVSAEATPPEAAAPISAPTGPTTLGEVTVALGDPTDAGLWVKSKLVTANTPGRVVTQTGRTLALTLRPLPSGSDGSAQISLAALQELGLPLVGLAPLTLITTP